MRNEDGRALSPEKIKKKIEQLGPWFQNINLGGVQTAPDHYLGDYPAIKWGGFVGAIPGIEGKTVLDVGCNAGFYSIEMKRRGASRVLGIDYDGDYLAQARFAADVCNVEVEFREMSVYDVGELHERFDIVLFLGVFYHLRHPLPALDLLREHVVGDLLIFQSMLRGDDLPAAIEPDYPFSERDVFKRPGFPCMYFIEGSYVNDPTNWWIPNRACVEAMLRSAGFASVGRPEEEVYLCRIDRDGM